ncbi:unnamed protein product [Ixodes pacificus]
MSVSRGLMLDCVPTLLTGCRQLWSRAAGYSGKRKAPWKLHLPARVPSDAPIFRDLLGGVGRVSLACLVKDWSSCLIFLIMRLLDLIDPQALVISLESDNISTCSGPRVGATCSSASCTAEFCFPDHGWFTTMLLMSCPFR